MDGKDTVGAPEVAPVETEKDWGYLQGGNGSSGGDMGCGDVVLGTVFSLKI